MAERVGLTILEVDWNMDKVLGATLEASKEIVSQDIKFRPDDWVKILREFLEANKVNRPAVIKNNYGAPLIEFKFPPDSGICEPIDESKTIFASVAPQIIVSEKGLFDDGISTAQFLNRWERLLRRVDSLATDLHLTAVTRSQLNFSHEFYAQIVNKQYIDAFAVG